ncbi:unnamed protein product [Closterium sp. NIES-64]|nr:unnamed protein product [Closterium sp. NIES-64]
MDDNGEDCVYFGRALEREEGAGGRKLHLAVAEGRAKQAVPPWQQEARDDEGRRRFHGAFTGGFSAGYFNSVGSKEVGADAAVPSPAVPLAAAVLLVSLLPQWSARRHEGRGDATPEGATAASLIPLLSPSTPEPPLFIPTPRVDLPANPSPSNAGWQPASFRSSRSQRAEVQPQRVEALMDADERHDAQRGAVAAQSAFDTFGFTAAERARQLAPAADRRPSVIPGGAVAELLAPAADSIGAARGEGRGEAGGGRGCARGGRGKGQLDWMGKALLRRMGWREGRGLGPDEVAASRKVHREGRRAMLALAAGGRGRGEGGGDDDGEAEGDEDDEEGDAWGGREEIVGKGRGARGGKDGGALAAAAAAEAAVAAQLRAPKRDTRGVGFDAFQGAEDVRGQACRGVVRACRGVVRACRGVVRRAEGCSSSSPLRVTLIAHYNSLIPPSRLPPPCLARLSVLWGVGAEHRQRTAGGAREGGERGGERGLGGRCRAGGGRQSLFAAGSGRVAGGFGIGALEEAGAEDEDIYDFEIPAGELHLVASDEDEEGEGRGVHAGGGFMAAGRRGQQGGQQGAQGGAQQGMAWMGGVGRGSSSAVLRGFCEGRVALEECKWYPPPHVPSSFTPHHVFPSSPPPSAMSAPSTLAPPPAPPPADAAVRAAVEGVAAMVARCGAHVEALLLSRAGGGVGEGAQEGMVQGASAREGGGGEGSARLAFLVGGEGSAYYRRRVWELAERQRAAQGRAAAGKAVGSSGGERLGPDVRGALLGEQPLPSSQPAPAPRLSAHPTPTSTAFPAAAASAFTSATSPAAPPAPTVPAFQQHGAAAELAAMMAARFHSSGHEDRAGKGGMSSEKAALPAAPGAGTALAGAAAVVVARRREEAWRPLPLLCKRFNLPDPYAGKHASACLPPDFPAAPCPFPHVHSPSSSPRVFCPAGPTAMPAAQVVHSACTLHLCAAHPCDSLQSTRSQHIDPLVHLFTRLSSLSSLFSFSVVPPQQAPPPPLHRPSQLDTLTSFPQTLPSTTPAPTAAPTAAPSPLLSLPAPPPAAPAMPPGRDGWMEGHEEGHVRGAIGGGKDDTGRGGEESAGVWEGEGEGQAAAEAVKNRPMDLFKVPPACSPMIPSPALAVFSFSFIAIFSDDEDSDDDARATSAAPGGIDDVAAAEAATRALARLEAGDFLEGLGEELGLQVDPGEVRHGAGGEGRREEREGSKGAKRESKAGKGRAGKEQEGGVWGQGGYGAGMAGSAEGAVEAGRAERAREGVENVAGGSGASEAAVGEERQSDQGGSGGGMADAHGRTRGGAMGEGRCALAAAAAVAAVKKKKRVLTSSSSSSASSGSDSDSAGSLSGRGEGRRRRKEGVKKRSNKRSREIDGGKKRRKRTKRRDSGSTGSEESDHAARRKKHKKKASRRKHHRGRHESSSESDGSSSEGDNCGSDSSSERRHTKSRRRHGDKGGHKRRNK